ncbi:MAG: trypsin-like peptidase domain-containing protein [Planctomycetota bacterium]
MLALTSLTASAEPTSVFDKPAPETLEDLREIEARVEAVAALAAPATVSLEIGFSGSGSGVIIGDEGYILTAAHVIGKAGQVIQVRFPDGTVETAETLGLDHQNDAGLAKLQGDGPWPSVEMAESDTLGVGDWVVSLGHPGGFDLERSVVVRLGRVLRIRKVVGIQSDCSLIGGDSGGPLFNMDGQVVGIHSRIGKTERVNIHVPIKEYHNAWDRFVAGREWGRRQFPGAGIMLAPDKQDRGVVVERMQKRGAAANSGIKIGDIITKIGDQPIRDDHAFHDAMALLVPGDEIMVTLLRGDDEVQIEFTMGEDR